MALKFEYDKERRTATVCGVDDKFCKEIIIPDTVEYYKKEYKVTSIGKETFSGCTSLTSVIIPNSVTSIGEDAFSDCSSLTSVHITDLSAWCRINFVNSAANPLTCAKNLYLNNILVKELVIPNNISVIKNYAFFLCKSLTSVTIPDSVTSIGEYAFFSCDSLTSVTIPDSVTEIGSYAFSECRSLTSVTIPNSVTTIGGNAFYGCSSLKEFKGKFVADNGRCLIKDSTFIAYAAASGTTYTLPDSVTSIGNYAFAYCDSLTSVTIPDSVTTIGDDAFYKCRSLTSVTIPDSVTTIGERAFGGCISLTSVTIPDSVTTIGDIAFYGCSSLTSVTIPDSVTTIGNRAFRGCISLTSVTIGDSVTTIGGCAFWDCSSLTSVTICNDEGCVNIKSAFMPSAKINYLGKKCKAPIDKTTKKRPAEIKNDNKEEAVCAEKKTGFFKKLFGKK